MKIYLYAETGSTSIKVTSLRAFSSIVELGKKVIRGYSDKKLYGSLEKYMTRRYSSIRVYEAEIDSENKTKRISPSALWKLIKAEEKLKPEITKSLLKNGI
jgi:hypothetical protein